MYSGSPSLDDELWKRVFWVLVVLDRTFSMQLARPCVLQEEDFDAELPLLLDDEYWEEPVISDSEDSSLGAPQARPSMMEAFICHIKLTQISAFALRTIVSCWYDFHHPRLTHLSTRSTSQRCCMVFLVLNGSKKSYRN
jgi:hypothetical protein